MLEIQQMVNFLGIILPQLVNKCSSTVGNSLESDLNGSGANL
jgi:hypothetical protein